MSDLALSKLTLKIYAAPGSMPPRPTLIEVFHDLIKSSALGEVMIDVVDYGHVFQGPSVLFCGHESDYVIDEGESRPGLLYRRKRAGAPGHGTESGALAVGARRLLDLAGRLEADPRLSGLAFDRREFLLSLTDRLHAPNDADTFASLKGLIEAEVGKVADQPVVAAREGADARAPLTVRLRAQPPT